MVVEPGEADHQPPSKEDKKHLEHLIFLNNIYLRALLGKFFTDNVRSRFYLSFVPGSGLRSRPHCSSQTWQETSTGQLVTGLALLRGKIFVTGAQCLQKVCRITAKAFGREVPVGSRGQRVAAYAMLTSHENEIYTCCDIGAAIIHM